MTSLERKRAYWKGSIFTYKLKWEEQKTAKGEVRCEKKEYDEINYGRCIVSSIVLSRWKYTAVAENTPGWFFDFPMYKPVIVHALFTKECSFNGDSKKNGGNLWKPGFPFRFSH